MWPGVMPQAWSQMRLILFKLLLYRHGNVLSVNCPKDILMNKYLLALNLDSDAVDGSPEHEDKQDAVVRNLVTQLNNVEAEESKNIVLNCWLYITNYNAT